MIILEKIFKFFRPIQKYGLFILEIVGWVIVLGFLTPVLGSFLQTEFPKLVISFSDFILLITAAFILAYTYETKKIRNENVFQRKMASAADIDFRMYISYGNKIPNTIFGYLFCNKGLNNVSKFSFLSGVLMKPIGKSGPFRPDNENILGADYFIDTEEGRSDFLNALKFQHGKIRAQILMTDGLRFLYTFQTVENNWEKALKGVEGLDDRFILVKKELDDI